MQEEEKTTTISFNYDLTVVSRVSPVPQVKYYRIIFIVYNNAATAGCVAKTFSVISLFVRKKEKRKKKAAAEHAHTTRGPPLLVSHLIDDCT